MTEGEKLGLKSWNERVETNGLQLNGWDLMSVTEGIHTW